VLLVNKAPTLLMSMQLMLVWLPVHLLCSLYCNLAVLLTNCWGLWKSCRCFLTNCFSLSTCWRVCPSQFPSPSTLPTFLLLVSSHCLLAAALAVPAVSQFQVLWGVRGWAASQWLQPPLFSSCYYCTSARYWQGETHSSSMNPTRHKCLSYASITCTMASSY